MLDVSGAIGVTNVVGGFESEFEVSKGRIMALCVMSTSPFTFS